MAEENPYRLPRTVIPGRYDMVLEPDLGSFSFTGRVTIAVDVVETTREVVLNAADLEISAATVGGRPAEVALDGVRQEADVGSRTTLDVLNAEQELLNARVALVVAERDEYVAAFDLRSAIGRLTAAQLALPVEVYDPAVHYRAVRNKLFGLGTPDEQQSARR